MKNIIFSFIRSYHNDGINYLIDNYPLNIFQQMI